MYERENLRRALYLPLITFMVQQDFLLSLGCLKCQNSKNQRCVSKTLKEGNLITLYYLVWTRTDYCYNHWDIPCCLQTPRRHGCTYPTGRSPPSWLDLAWRVDHQPTWTSNKYTASTAFISLYKQQFIGTSTGFLVLFFNSSLWKLPVHVLFKKKSSKSCRKKKPPSPKYFCPVVLYFVGIELHLLANGSLSWDSPGTPCSTCPAP